jgi:hypothetical protein
METQTRDKFLASYIETAFWSSTDDDGTPLDGDLADNTMTAMQKDCAEFEPRALALIDAYNADKNASAEFLPGDGHLAHDFWLTRNHHGAGFWDGDYPEPLGQQLTDLAHSFKECDLYTGDDGKLYLWIG